MTVTTMLKTFLIKVRSDEPIFNNAHRYGIRVRQLGEISLPLGATRYWRVIGVHHLTGTENRGNHHVYADILDEDGERINGAKLILKQNEAPPEFAVIDKPPHEPGTNFPMWSNTRATVAVHYDDLPSEEVCDLRTDHADEEVGNTWGHHSFYVVFQRTPVSAPSDATSLAGPNERVSSLAGPSLSLEETVASVGQPHIIPLNPNAGFYKIAREQSLGERLTREYDVDYQGKKYRAQIYEKGIVYAEVGDLDNIKIIPSVN